MAEKRMYTKKVTDSDAFIEMSSSAQALYFHLNQGADDDGFNNQVQAAMFKAHATIDDLKVLMCKNFIIRFKSGVIVIKHWRMHNTLRKDRYTPTNFQEELAQLGLKENGSYTLGCQMVAKRLPNGCHSIDQSSIDKISIDKSIYQSNDNILETDRPTTDRPTDEYLFFKSSIERFLDVNTDYGRDPVADAVRTILERMPATLRINGKQLSREQVANRLCENMQFGYEAWQLEYEKVKNDSRVKNFESYFLATLYNLVR